MTAVTFWSLGHPIDEHNGDYGIQDPTDQQRRMGMLRNRETSEAKLTSIGSRLVELRKMHARWPQDVTITLPRIPATLSPFRVDAMKISDVKDFLNLVNAEARRRKSLRNAFRDYAYDEWVFKHLPFLHDLFLLFLVAIRHDIERSLLFLAACATDHGNPITRAEYDQRMNELQTMQLRKRWEVIEDQLSLTESIHYKSIEALRLLANYYKHDPGKQPSAQLIKCLGLDANGSYAPIPESEELQKGLARIVGLPEKALYADIVERFVEQAEEYLKDARSRNRISKVNPKFLPV